MKKKVILCIIGMFILLGVMILVIFNYKVYRKLELINVNVSNYDEENKVLKINLQRKVSPFNSDFYCHADGVKNTYNVKGENNKCELVLDINDSYTLYLSNSKNDKSNVIKLNDVFNGVLSFKFKNDTLYMIKDKKTLLPCDAYNEEEAELLDKILEYKINDAGYQTRAGAVAAARFLTLEFNYRIPYFYENGRVPISSTNKFNINTHIADGEGRYYKKGLYLSKNKYKDITASWKGPSIWGCGLTNLETEPRWGYIVGKKMPNGLDCSGFVTWSLKNAGFEPGDVGAGESPYNDNQCTDLGEFKYLSQNINNIKVGDLLNWWGHIAMLIGIDGDTYYVAESLSYIGGVRAMIYSKNELLKTFEYVVLMDKFYKNDGNYQKFW